MNKSLNAIFLILIALLCYQRSFAQVVFRDPNQANTTMPYNVTIGSGSVTANRLATVGNNNASWTVTIYKPSSNTTTECYVMIGAGDNNGNINTIISASRDVIWGSVSNSYFSAGVSGYCDLSLQKVSNSTMVYAIVYDKNNNNVLAVSPGITLAFPPAQPPTITSLSPSNGPVGTQVTISGTNLSSATQVTFNGTPATFTFQNPSLSAIVPAGATTGPVVVTTPAGSSSLTFTVIPPATTAPVLLHLSPGSGRPGNSVAITANDNWYRYSITSVTFNGVQVGYSMSSNPYQLGIIVPPNATTGNIVVNTTVGASNGLLFTVTPPPAPVITSITPDHGPVGGTPIQVTFSGSDLGELNGPPSVVSFNGVAATVYYQSPTRLGAWLPATATTGPVTLTNANGVSSNSVLFTVTQPTVANVLRLQSNGGKAGDVVLVSTDVDWRNYESKGYSMPVVKFNGIPSPSVRYYYTIGTGASLLELEAVVPAGLTDGDVVVTNQFGTGTGVYFSNIAQPYIPCGHNVAICGNQCVAYGAVPLRIEGRVLADNSNYDYQVYRNRYGQSVFASGDEKEWVQWEMRTDNTPWTPINGATDASYQPGPITQTTYFHRVSTHQTNSFSLTRGYWYTSEEVVITYNCTQAVTAITNGYYLIKSKRSGKVLDVKDGSRENGTFLQRFSYTGAANQQWMIKRIGTFSNPQYVITSRRSGLALDVKDGSSANGARVQQWSYGGGNNQKWLIQGTDGGYVKIISVGSGLALDVDESTNKIQQWSYGGGYNQQWNLVDLNNGYYAIKSRADISMGLDVIDNTYQNGTAVQQWTAGSSSNQHWLVEALPTQGQYTIKARRSGAALDLIESNPNNGALVQQYVYGEAENQKWVIAPAAAGSTYFAISNVLTGKALDVKDASLDDGAAIQQWSYGGGDNQQWEFYKLSPDDFDAAMRSAPTTQPPISSNEIHILATKAGKTPEDAYQLFPNPAADVLNVILPPNADLKKTVVEVFSIQGARVQNLIYNAGGIDVHALAPGVYVVRIIDGQLVKQLRFVKQ